MHKPLPANLAFPPRLPGGLKIFNIGPASGTSLHRANAMRRLGHVVTLIDPRALLPRSAMVTRWLYKTGGAGVGMFIDDRIVAAAVQAAPDVIWVDQGAFLGPSLLRRLKQMLVPIVNYIIDDPFGGRDGRRFNRMMAALPHYDLVTVPRAQNVAEAHDAGARRVLAVWMTADEVAHRPRPLTPEDSRLYGSLLCFVGTWMPERGPFMRALIRAGLPVSIWGDRWHKAECWAELKPHWRGPAVHDDDIYAKIIQCSQVALGLLSKGNRDLHTTRSMEIPALGGLLCAERTDEHMALYREGTEAMFWRNAEECFVVCRGLLDSETKRREIAAAGQARLTRNATFNETIISGILANLLNWNDARALKSGMEMPA